MEATPLVSVIVPSFNMSETVGETVDCLLKQSESSHEIIVVDDGSTDGTAKRLREQFRDRITVIARINGGPASARNTGIQCAKGRYVAFTDADCLPSKHWLTALIAGFDASSVGGVGGAVRGTERGLLSDYATAVGLLNPVMHGDSVIHLVTANACFRRDVLIEAGRFDERFTRPGGEDTELSVRVKRLGYELRFASDAFVLHHHKNTFRSLLKAFSNYGEGWYLMSRLWPDQRRSHNAFPEPARTLIAARNGALRAASYVKPYGLRRSAAYLFIDSCAFVADSWGYWRGRRRSREFLPYDGNGESA